jgi:hypothetical protein
LTVDYFDSVHPLPEVCIFILIRCRIFIFFDLCCSLPLYSTNLFICRVTNSLFHTPSSRGRAPSG